MLQCRSGKRTGAGAVKIAVDLVNEGLVDKATAVTMVEPTHLDQLLHPQVGWVTVPTHCCAACSCPLSRAPGLVLLALCSLVPMPFALCHVPRAVCPVPRDVDPALCAVLVLAHFGTPLLTFHAHTLTLPWVVVCSLRAQLRQSTRAA